MPSWSKGRLFAAAALCAGAGLFLFAISHALVFSNYAIELNLFGISPFEILPANNRGAEPERYLYLPLYQILVNNHFGRFNMTSPFGEDLRSLFGLPIWDWALVFKPNYWLFFIIPPEYAFSFHHLFMVTAFIAGYTLLFRRLGLSAVLSAILAVGLFYSSFLQYWYLMFIGLVALLPWVLLSVLIRNRLLAAAATFYTSMAWLLTNLYPPLVIPLAITGLVYLLLTMPFGELLRRSPLLALAGAAAVGLVVFYLKDALAITAGTSYPGSRISPGGEGVPVGMWLSQFLPTYFVQGTKSLVPVEAGEAAGAGNTLFLGLVFFADYRHLLSDEGRAIRRRLAIPVAVLLVFWIWMLVPLPSWAGTPLLLQYVTSRRLVFGSGFLMAIVAALAMAHLRFRFTLGRLAAVGAFAGLFWFSLVVYQSGLPAFSLSSALDLAVLPAGLAGLMIARRRGTAGGLATFAALATLVNVAGFGTLNGIVSAQQIFRREGSTLKPVIDAIAATSATGLVALPGERLNGSILNGWGYRSAAQGFMLPAPGFYRSFFPAVPEDRFQFVFNRFSIVRLRNFRPLDAPGLLVQAPVQAFGVKQDFRPVVLGKPPTDGPEDGVFSVAVEGDAVLIDGWARWDGFSPMQTLYVETDAAVTKLESAVGEAPFNGVNALNGFSIRISLREGEAAAFASRRLRLYSQDADGSVRTLEKR